MDKLTLNECIAITAILIVALPLSAVIAITYLLPFNLKIPFLLLIAGLILIIKLYDKKKGKE